MKLTTNEKEQALQSAGFYLRDDTEMRKGWDDVISGETPAEAYSLCHESDPYPIFSFEKYWFQRFHVFAGPRNWAIEQSYKLVFETNIYKKYEKSNLYWK